MEALIQAEEIEEETVMNNNARTRTQLSVILCAAGALAIGANSALAGEITGNGKNLKQDDGTLHGRSECAFSGLNDVWSGDPDVPGADGFFRTQSWGQLSQATRYFLRSAGMGPGDACNPS
jgi:hypothetical protein